MILYGPPGTGKTHRAKIIASEITEIPIGKVEEEIENADGRIKLVQYHPSYSYFDLLRASRLTRIAIVMLSKIKFLNSWLRQQEKHFLDRMIIIIMF